MDGEFVVFLESFAEAITHLDDEVHFTNFDL